MHIRMPSVDHRMTCAHTSQNIFEYARDLFLEDPWRNFLAPTVKFVIFMAQRPAANMAVLRVKAKLTITLSDSAKCWRLLGNEGVFRLTQDVSIIIWNLFVPTVRYVIFMIQRQSSTLRLEVFSLVQSNFRCIFVNLRIWADYRGSETQENDLQLQRQLLFRETYFWNMSSAIHYRLHSTLKPLEQEDHSVLSLMSAFGGRH